jgi:lipoate-protein ligase A
MLWQSHNTVVVGKHQNLLAEVNYPYCLKNKIKLSRRISGGGTVFHDRGNVNFSFIKNVKSPAEISFKQFTQPIVEALARLGVEAGTTGRNDLVVDGKKVSGNAEHVFKNRVLHHGTLLFNSDLKNLGQAINVIPGKYQSKAVQSNRSPVTNISSYLKNKISVNDFVEFLLNVQLEENTNQDYQISDVDILEIEKLVVEKFTTWDWIYGYSPAYTFKNEVEIDGKTYGVELKVKKGIIQECILSGDFEYNLNITANSFIGLKHDYSIISELCEKMVFTEIFF